MLKLKDFYIAKKITEEFLLSDDLLERTLAEFRRTQPFIAILNRAVQFAYDEPVGRLAMQMDDKQVAAFVAAVNELGTDE